MTHADVYVCPRVINAQAYIALHGMASHVDSVGRLWATYQWSMAGREPGTYVSGETSEVILDATYAGIRAWLGY